MNNQHNNFLFKWAVFTLIFILTVTGCGAGNVVVPTASSVPEASPAPESVEPTPTSAPVSQENVLYQDDFTNPATGWTEEKFDNYFIGYHEPEYYHVELTGSNYKTTVFEPEKRSFDDATIEMKVFAVAAKTAPDGDFNYGAAFRRSGDQYYAFTISPRTKKWTVLKSSPNELVVLTEGTEESIHDLDAEDLLRVDAQGSDFSFYINDKLVSQISDADYAAGEVGLYAQTVDSPGAHIHFDTLTVKELDTAQQPDLSVLYEDNFANPATGWTEEKFDNYFIGYHEPEYYHVEITSPNYKTAVFQPEKRTFDNVTIEAKVFTVSAKTAPEGDFNYGTVFRRSGDQYYAFTISPRTKKWTVLKSSSTALTVLQEGVEESIHDLDAEDILRVDAQGSDFFLHINDRLVGEFNDPDYATGEVGLYVQTVDSPGAHIHFDTLTIRDFEAPQPTQPDLAVLYQDDFANPATQWAEKKFDNYFIGYHEPEYYHVEITSPNYKTTVFEPGKRSFGDATVELKVFTVSAKTAADGDFNYGAAFRRSGDQYYAFTISPRTKKWTVLKSSSTALTVLQEGVEESIHDLDAEDILRVDAQGSDFFFYINDKLVGQVSDSDYAAGEVGLYVQTVDSPGAHIHFDDIKIQEFKASLSCNVNALTLNVRSGPSTSFASFAFLKSGDKVEPLGRTSDATWIRIKVEGSENEGWVFNSDEFITCDGDIKLLPVLNP